VDDRSEREVPAVSDRLTDRFVELGRLGSGLLGLSDLAGDALLGGEVEQGAGEL
jgi:hypothetical protein